MKRRLLAISALCVCLLAAPGCVAVAGDAEECPCPCPPTSSAEPPTELAAACA